MSMTVTYTKQVSRCEDCPNCSVLIDGSHPPCWCDKANKRTDRDTIPTWCPLRPAPGEEWTRVEDGLPVKDSLSEEDVWVYLGKGVSKPRVTTAPARFKDDGTMFGAFGALTEFVTHWRYRRTPAPPTGE